MKSPDRDAADEKALAREMCRLVVEEVGRRPTAMIPPFWIFDVCAQAAASELATLRRRVAEMEGESEGHKTDAEFWKHNADERWRVLTDCAAKVRVVAQYKPWANERRTRGEERLPCFLQLDFIDACAKTIEEVDLLASPLPPGRNEG